MHRRTQSVYHLVIVAVALMLSACATASLSQVRQFGSAGSALSDSTINTFNYLNEVEVQRKIYFIAADKQSGPTDDTFTGFFKSKTSSEAGSSESREQTLAVRLSVLEALGDYSMALHDLAAADFASDIDSASAELNSSLVSLSETYKEASGNELGISQQQLGWIATATNAIGKAIAARKQREAIRVIVTNADPAIQRVCLLLTTEFGSGSEMAMYASGAVGATRLALQTAYNRERENPDSTFDHRLTQLQRIRDLYAAQNGTVTLFEDVSNGSRATADAHAAMVRAVSTKEFSSAELAEAIGEMSAYIKSVQDFQASLVAPK